MSDDVTITVRVNNQTAQGFRDVNGRIRDMNGRFATAAGDMNRSSGVLSKALVDVRASLLSLAPAAVPVAASLAPIAVQAGAAGLAMAAFGAAVIPQIGHLGDAAKAQDKYADSVAKFGRGSKQAAAAALAQQQTLAGMPVATQRASVAWQGLRDQFKAFSDQTADFTMIPVEKSFAVLGQIIPKLTPMAKGAASQLDRLVTVAGGAVNSPGFDALSEKVSDFANNALKSAIDKTISFSRALSEGNAHGPIASFFEYARQQGPAVKELLTNVSEAVSNLLQGAAQAGPGLLTLVNAMAKLVASVPPELVGNLMSIYAAFKLIKLTGAGVGALAGGFANLGAKIAALKAASVAAGGGIAGMNAALNTLTTGGRAALAVGVVGGLALAMHKLTDDDATVAVDKLATSLNTLATTGKVTGELSTHMDDMAKSIAMVSKGASDNKILTMVSDFGSWIGIATGPGISEAKENVAAWDKVMADNVRSGHTKEAAAQYEILRKAWIAGGGDLKELDEATTGYRDAQADVKFETDMAAQAMGGFGSAAQATQATLDAQKGSADGLRQSLIALNDVNRSAYDAQIGFEASLDALTASFKEHGATLNLDTAAGQANGQAMSAAAKAQDELIATGVAAGDSFASMSKKSSELRETMMRLAVDAFDGNKKKAQEYVNTLLGTPSEIKTLVKAEKDQAIAGLQEVRSAVQATPGSKEVTVSTLNGAAIAALNAVGLKTEQLPDGRTKVYTANGTALGAIGAVSSAMNKIDGKSATTYVVTKYRIEGKPGGPASGTYLGSTAGRSADGNIYRGRSYADGGMEQHVAQIAQPTFRMWAEPETGGEAYIPLSPAKRGRSRDIAEQTVGILGGQVEWFAKGGLTKSQMKGLSSPSDMSSLTATLSDVRSRIKDKSSGAAEARLLHALDAVGKKLIAHEKSLTSVNKALDGAKSKLNDLRSSASQLSGSVKSGVLSASSITKSGDDQVSVQSIMGGLIASRDKATAFSSALKGLQGKGLRADLIQQIAEAGIGGGGLETAGALLGASSSEIGTANSLQSQIAAAAKTAGQTTSTAVYGAAIKAQTTATNKLQASQDRLERTMSSLAKSLNKRLGGKAAGGIVGAAASGGIRDGLTWVGEHEPELLDLPVGSRVWSGPDSRRKTAAPWSSMLNTPRRAAAASAAPAAAHGGSEQPIVIQVRIGEKDFGELWVETGRRRVKAIGSIEATLKPPRGR